MLLGSGKENWKGKKNEIECNIFYSRVAREGPRVWIGERFIPCPKQNKAVVTLGCYNTIQAELLKQRHLFLPVLEVRKPQVKVLADLLLSEDLRSTIQMVTFLLHPHMSKRGCSGFSSRWVLISSQGSTPLISFKPYCLKTSTILRTSPWEVELQHVHFVGTHIFRS